MISASRQRNYLQSGLYVIIAGILAAVLLERLLTYAEAAEKMAMEATIGQLQAGLYTRVAYHALRGEHGRIEALPRRSPFVTAVMQAPNYLGEFDGVPADPESGSWLYDRVANELVYVPNLKRHLFFRGTEAPPRVLRFRLEVSRSSGHAYAGVALRPVVDFRWDPLSDKSHEVSRFVIGTD